MITGRNIVCIASNWHDHPTSKHHVMRALAAQNDVVWVNYHASRRPRLTAGDSRVIMRRLRQVWAGAQRVAPHIEAVSPLLVPWPESSLARWANAHLLAWQIRAALQRLPRRPVQLWLFTPDAPEVIRLLAPERVVYYCVDEFAAFAGFNTALIERLEQRTLAAADLVLATSQPLHERLRGQHPRVHFVPHGVDYAHFAAAAELAAEARPDDVRDLPGPVLGYFGLISDYVDLELLAAAARRRPAWSFVLLGDVRCDTGVCTGLPNVHLLGARPYAELPRYCRAFDVGLIPFRMNRLVRAVNPIKLREYLAAGLPVVSSPMPEVLRYAPAVQTAETCDEFIAATERALELGRQSPRAARQALVASESWAARVAQLAALVNGESAPDADLPPIAAPAGRFVADDAAPVAVVSR